MNWRLETVLESIKGAVICEVKGTRTAYESGAAAKEYLKSRLKGKYTVGDVKVEHGDLVIYVIEDTTIQNDMNADWVKEFVAQYGKEPDFF